MSYMKKTELKAFTSLGFIFIVCVLFVFLRQYILGWNVQKMMTDFMASFFLLLGILKVVNLKGFVLAYKEYDLITIIFPLYGYMYPFIEIALGIGYLFLIAPFLLSLITLVLMIISAVGVVYAILFSQKKLMCACLGDLLKVPLTYVTIFENIIMALMALYILYIYW